VSYSATLAARWGTTPYTWSLPWLLLERNELPPGLNLASDGTISGVPTIAGVYSFTVQVRDRQGRTAQERFIIVVVGER
jgi:hypothetical protein